MKPIEKLDADTRSALEQSMVPPLPSIGAGAYAHYLKAVDWDLYHDVARQIGVPHSMPDGLVAHFAGESGSSIDVFDLWSDFETMDEFFALILAESITNSIAQVERRNDVEPEHERIDRVVFGAAARAFVNANGDSGVTDYFDRDDRPVGFAIGDEDDDANGYLQSCAELGVPERLPSALIVQLVERSDARTVVFEAWSDAAEADRWHNATRCEQPIRPIDLMRISLRPELFDT
jgi:hypothetical protein